MINIRKAVVTDSKALVNLSKQLGYETTEELLLKRFYELEKRSQEVYIAEEEDTVVGYISFEPYYTLYVNPGINITALVVDQNYQKKGIGKQLVKIAEEYTIKHGYSFLRANSSSSRTEAHKFYRKMGFDNEKEQKRFIKEYTDGLFVKL
jgi:ribosomal protein S18 acetylase RimI-like enzyme